MLKSQSIASTLAIVALASIVVSMPATAAEIEESRTAATISWTTDFAWDHAVISISGPAGVTSWTVPEGQPIEVGAAALALWAKAMAKPIDGGYTYEVYFAPKVDEATRAEFDRLRAESEGMELKGAVVPELPMVSGHFIIADGVMVGEAEENAAKDQQILDDLIVDGSLCVGMDCVNGESFGFDTVRLKENNLRIKFQDTSNTASFPTNDWEITANDSANGGASFLAFRDVDNSRYPFLVEAGSPANSLYVEDYGRIGFGTSTPVVELHVKDSDTPTLRLEQDSSGGWTPQTWDVAGNESNFFIRDATNGSQLSFRIQPGAPSSTLSLKSDGAIGMGTWSPAAALEIERTGSVPAILLDYTSVETWYLAAAADGTFTVGTSDVVGDELLILDASGNLTTSGTVNGISDVAAKKDFAPVNGAEVLAAVSRLGITEWTLVNDSNGARHMGPTAQDFRAAFGLGADERHISLSDISGVALAAIQGLLGELEARDREIEELNDRLERLERVVGNLQ
jgi:hypothetical protein